MLYKPGPNDFFLVLVSSDVQVRRAPQTVQRTHLYCALSSEWRGGHLKAVQRRGGHPKQYRGERGTPNSTEEDTEEAWACGTTAKEPGDCLCWGGSVTWGKKKVCAHLAQIAAADLIRLGAQHCVSISLILYGSL